MKLRKLAENDKSLSELDSYYIDDIKHGIHNDLREDEDD